MAKAEKQEQERPDTALFVADAGAGFDEGIDAGAYAIPFLGILQALSPQCQRGHQAFINGANPGLLFNTVTKELFETVEVSCVRRTHTFCTWNKREEGGGFLGEIEATVDAVQAYAALPLDEKKRRINPEGKQVSEHRNFFCQIIRNGTATEPVLISMASSQLKVAREWNTQISIRSARVNTDHGPMPVAPSEVWRLGTMMRTKDNNSWYVFTVAHVRRHTDPALYGEVRAAISQAKEIKLLARPAQEEEEAGGGEV